MRSVSGISTSLSSVPERSHSASEINRLGKS
jgi:hypothetical protein